MCFFKQCPLDPNPLTYEGKAESILLADQCPCRPAPSACPHPSRARPLQDMFAAAVSLVTGKIMYISDQVASIFHCKRGAFYDAKFVEFLAPHDVSVFHSATTPYKLPPWSVCSGGECPAVAARGRGHVGPPG